MGRYVKWCCFLDLRCIRLANPKRITISGYLPVVSNYYRMASGGWIEMTAVPKADMGGSMEQRCFYRFQKVDGSGDVNKTQYYDTFAYTAGGYQSPAQVPASGEPPGSAVSKLFYAEVLEQQRWWREELASERMTTLDLPADGATDGAMLAKMSAHSVVRDMITRRNTYFPK